MSQWTACLTSWSHLHDSFFLMAILPGHYKVKQLIIFMIVGCLLALVFPSWGTLSLMQACLILLPFCSLVISSQTLYTNILESSFGASC